jgi:hypothetical protein
LDITRISDAELPTNEMIDEVLQSAENSVIPKNRRFRGSLELLMTTSKLTNDENKTTAQTTMMPIVSCICLLYHDGATRSERPFAG